MKFFLAVRGDVQDAWYGLVLVTMGKEEVQEILQLKELYQMVKSKEPTLHEMRFLDRVPAPFYEDAAVDEVLNETEQEQYEGEEFIVLTKNHDLSKLGDPARTEIDCLVLSDEGFSFRAYPKHEDYSISSVEVTYDQLLEWSKADG